ncbi:hypothetical protein [Pseudomonas sp. Fl4BN1]|uniref:hypothetical protein n=1 Tax=Pseudomonas sp. Fl4BN1 TaxID=2697651 RepID=UPI002114067E|nr:hypothetical protein [Pseudomonas sp. Fl4BN1]
MASLGTIYDIWLIYAAGLEYLLLSMIFYAPELDGFMYAHRQRGPPSFGNTTERVIGLLVLALALVTLWIISSGRLSL